jgi:glycosyltransferase involved in cell wall biosynthesis
MRILIASKILGVAAYRGKLDALAAQPDVERLVAVAPPAWKEPGGRTLAFEPTTAPAGYEMRVEPIRFNGSFHLFYWPGLAGVLREVQPDLVHLDEEPYNLATALGVRAATRVAAKSVFFTWQNLRRSYPPPFSLFERYVFRQAAHGIAGSREALDVIRQKGFSGPASVIPQFGIDPDLFSPGSAPDGVPVIGFVARLVEEKGVFVLLRALAGLQGEWRLHVIGSGPLAAQARQMAAALGLAQRITWEPSVPSRQIPDRLRTFSLLVQPSLTRRNWKEQFGRALMEAMACGVAVVGSNSGEIPYVVGDAGCIVPEGDVEALRLALARLLGDTDGRRELARRGRARALRCFTHQRIAEQTITAYRSALGTMRSHAS